MPLPRAADLVRAWIPDRAGSLIPLAVSLGAFSDCRRARDHVLRPLHDRDVDHRAFELHRTEALSEGRVVGSDHPFGTFDFRGGWREFLVQHRHLEWVDRAGAGEAQAFRAAD